ncbi:MAG: hypothetical protein ACR2J3_08555 [Aridibacter sp.]
MNIKIHEPGSENEQNKSNLNCRLCGVLITVKEKYQNPCPNCLKNEPETLLKRFDEIDRKALKQELDLELNLKEYIISEDAAKVYGDEWHGYQVEFMTVKVGRYSELDWETYKKNFKDFKHCTPELQEKIDEFIRMKETPHMLMPFPTIHVENNPDLIVMLCRMRVFYEGDSFYSEMKMHSFGVRRISIQGLERSKTKRDLERAWKGLELLRKLDKKYGGRPKGSPKMSAKEFRKRSVEIYAEYLETYNEQPRAVYIAEELGLKIDTFHRQMKKNGWKMPALRTKAEKK